MCPVLAIYGQEDILDYIRGTLEDDEEKQDIESLVESDPRAAKIVSKLSGVDISDQETFDEFAQQRLKKLQKIAERVSVLS